MKLFYRIFHISRRQGTGYLSWIRSKDKIIIDLLEQQAALAARKAGS
jgi:hypothetical protein